LVAPASGVPDPSRVLVIGCGALARELVAVIDQAGLSNVDLTCLPATLHNRPGGIPAGVRAKIRAARPRYERIFIAYADCGTGGLLDAMLADEGVERLPGAHCYEFYSGSSAFAAMSQEEPGTFYLTDFLARNFDRLVIAGLGLDRHPELLPTYFGNYRRLVYLAQTDDPTLVVAARRAARRLGLAFEVRTTGYGELAASVIGAATAAASASHQAPGSVDFLRGQQRDGRRPVGEPRDLLPRQERRRGTFQPERFLRPRQRVGGFLPGRQHSGEPTRDSGEPTGAAASRSGPGAA
jgi:hypothetical protein